MRLVLSFTALLLFCAAAMLAVFGTLHAMLFKDSQCKSATQQRDR